MLNKKGSSVLLGITMFLIILALGFSSMFTGCATTGAGAGAQKTTGDAAQAAKEKAKQDSIRKAYEFELAKEWSLAYENYKGKMYPEAVEHFWKVVKIDTVQKFSTVYRYLGDSYLKLEKPDSAEIVYEMAVEEYPENSYYHRSLGWLLSGKREYAAATEHYEKAIELEENPPADDYRALGNLLLQENRIEEALPVYEKLVQLEPDNAEAQSIIAQLHKSTGDEEAALEAQEKALVADPTNTKLMFSLGESYFKRGEYNKSIEKLNMYLKSNPEDVYALELLGNSYQNVNQYQTAISTYERLLSVKPDHKKAYAEMAASYKELGNFQRARSTVGKALNIDSNYGLAHIVLGEIYEATADDCINQREKRKVVFDDKLVYKMAYDQYQKAQSDPQFSDTAKRRMNYIQQDIPTKEDYFMNPDQKQPQLDCYKWL